MRTALGEAATVGDLVVVRVAGQERLALVADEGVRLWRADLRRFEREAVQLQASAILRLANDGEKGARK